MGKVKTEQMTLEEIEAQEKAEQLALADKWKAKRAEATKGELDKFLESLIAASTAAAALRTANVPVDIKLDTIKPSFDTLLKTLGLKVKAAGGGGGGGVGGGKGGSRPGRPINKALKAAGKSMTFDEIAATSKKLTPEIVKAHVSADSKTYKVDGNKVTLLAK